MKRAVRWVLWQLDWRFGWCPCTSKLFPASVGHKVCTWAF